MISFSGQEPFKNSKSNSGKIILLIASNFWLIFRGESIILLISFWILFRRMLNTVEKFCQRNGMKIAPQKCKTLSYIKEGNKRISIDYNLKIQNEDIPNQPLLEAIQYLGAPINMEDLYHHRNILNKRNQQVNC